MKIYIAIILIFCSVVIFNSCTVSDKQQIVDVTAQDFKFNMNDEIPSGWTTFRFINSGHAPHFFLLNKLPDSISFETYHEKVTKPFNVVMDSLNAGSSKEAAIGLLTTSIPEWYFTSVKVMGGAGIIDAGKEMNLTIKLEPGVYAMECYIKEKGVFHTALGMIKKISITGEVSATEPPSSNVDIDISNSGYTIKGDIKKGENTIAVHFNEQPEFGLGNDVHLVQVDNDSMVKNTIEWLDWMNIKGLEPPAPVSFLGGAQEMPVGNTAYFTVNIEAANYAWIAESTANNGLLKTFTVQ